MFNVYDILGFTILLKYFHRLSFKILEWGCEKFGNEIDFGKTVNKEELYDLLRWFYTEVQPKEELVEISQESLILRFVGNYEECQYFCTKRTTCTKTKATTSLCLMLRGNRDREKARQNCKDMAWTHCNRKHERVVYRPILKKVKLNYRLPKRGVVCFNK